MRYPVLPPVGKHSAPTATFHASPNVSSRGGRPERLVFTHVWGGGTFEEVVGWLRDPKSQASSHFVYAGEIGPDAGKCAQLVPLGMKAWTECELNPVGISIEAADAIWHGHDAEGFARLARMVALLLHVHHLPARWVRSSGIVAGSAGFARHADAGALGCGHLECPTGDLDLYRQFAERVVSEFRHGHFRNSYGKA